MKKTTVALAILATIGSIVIVTTVLLFIIGFRPLIPDVAVEPNWDAWQTVSTVLLAIATLCLSWYIARRQENLAKEQNKLSGQQEMLKSEAEDKRFQIERDIASKELEAKVLALKISLYDKRYRVYECFRKYPFDVIESNANAGQKPMMTLPDGKSLNGAELTSAIIFNGSFIGGRNKTLEELKIFEEKKILTRAEHTKMNILIQRMGLENIEFWKSEVATIEQAEFCFDNSEARMLITFIKAMFEYANPMGIQHSEAEFKKIQNDLLKIIEEIKNSYLVDKIKESLCLSYSEINN